jgi:hypothetical protein
MRSADNWPQGDGVTIKNTGKSRIEELVFICGREKENPYQQYQKVKKGNLKRHLKNYLILSHEDEVKHHRATNKACN